MTKDTENITTAAELRHKVEEQVANPYFKSSVQNEIYTSRILHELQVHQVELEMQNEELHRIIEEKNESELHLRNIISQTPAGYFRIDPEGYFLDVNDAWLRMYCYDSKDEVVGKHFSVMQVDSSSFTALSHLAELQRGRPIPYGEFESRRKDGSVGHHIFSAHPVVRSGTIIGFEWFIIDISRRKKAELSLQRKQEMLERTEKISHIGSWEWEVATDTVTWSGEMFRIVQRDPADGAPSIKEHSKICHPDDFEELKRVVGIALNEGMLYEIELRAIRPDGETRYCLARGFAERTIGGITTRLYGSLQDITERKIIEEQLRKSEKQYRSLFEMMDEGYCVVDLIHDANGKPVDFRFLEINPAFVKQTGLHQALGKTMRQLVPDFEDFWFEIYDEVIRTGESRRFENHTAAMDRFYDVFAFCIGEEGKQRIGILFNDITNRKKAEAEKANLEYRLNQAQKMEAIGQLAGGVAHDFNNKLMAILGNAELAKMDIHDSDMVMNYLNEIRRAAEHSRDITYRLLAFSRQQVVTPQVLDANKIIADALKSLARLIGEHISISFEPCDNLWNILMDPVQLDQVVMNLAINARDAMPDGGSLIIETRNTTCDISSSSSIDAIPGDYVMVTFSDTGTGMDKKTLKHIFEPFFTTKEVGKGTGLGLATIYGIIRQNDGFIDVASNVGYGTEFRLYIPRFSASKTETTKVADTLCTGSCSILLVEDEDAVRSMTSLFLKKIGYTVHEVATPRAALELARDFSIQIDLVLTDFLMPEMNGRVMMEQILELRPQLQCIYASGFTAKHVLLSEEENFIQKPYDFIKLSGYLKRVLGGSEEQ